MKGISQTRQFLKDLRRMQKRGKNPYKLQQVVTLLAHGERLPEKYRDHALTGPWEGTRDCHVEPDWILLYTLDENLLCLERTGTHSDLF